MSNHNPHAAELVTSRVGRFPPTFEARLEEGRRERRFAELIAATPHTRYRVISKQTGASYVETVRPAQLMDIWPTPVLTADEFVRRWSLQELRRLLACWNRQPSGWMYLPVDD